jgi:hypothetical protein
VDEADEEIDLEDDEFIEIDEPTVYQADPCLRDSGAGEEDGGDKKEAEKGEEEE